MTWNIVVRVGSLDSYLPEIAADTPRIIVAIDDPGNRSAVKDNIIKTIQQQSLVVPSAQIADLLNLAIAAYTADLKIKRELSHDRWTRDFLLHFPVTDVARWNQAIPQIEDMLAFLTGDRWSIQLRQGQRSPFSRIDKASILSIDAVSLFSGGLDSLVGAIDLLEDGQRVALVGHHGAGITKSIQSELLSELQQTYRNQIVPYMFYVQPSKRGTGMGEPTMRSRSLLFLSLGTLVANLFPHSKPLVVAENGLISLNVPLTHSRIGSLSTRTTHPHFIALYQAVLTSLQINTSVLLPYRFKTKGEMLAQAKSQKVLGKLALSTMSCSHPESGRYSRNAPDLPCGYCVPCVIRRAALRAINLDQEEYQIDVLSEPPDFKNKKGRDFRAFEMAVSRFEQLPFHKVLFLILNTGPVPPDEVKEYASVYLRGINEVRTLLTAQ